MSLCHIVAMAENRVIGADGDMPWHIPAELKHFKQTTMGQCLVMGRKTYESIGRPLPGRLNVVVTRNPDFSAPGVEVASSIEDAIAICDKAIAAGDYGPDIFIVGGGQIYASTLAMVDRIHLTVIHREVDGDTHYPDLDRTVFEERDVQDFEEPERYTTSVLVRH